MTASTVSTGLAYCAGYQFVSANGTAVTAVAVGTVTAVGGLMVTTGVQTAYQGITVVNNNQKSQNITTDNSSRKKHSTSSAPSKKVMHEAIIEWTKMQEDLAGSKRQIDKFNTATVAYDAKTGQFCYDMNRGVQLSGDTLNPELSKWLPAESLNQYRLGNCAEVDAVNQALNAGANISNIFLYTINTKNCTEKPMCENCVYTFLG